MRREKKYEKLNKAHDKWMGQQQMGEGYQLGIAMAMALVKKTYLILPTVIQKERQETNGDAYTTLDSAIHLVARMPGLKNAA